MGGNENKKFHYIGRMVIDKSGRKKIGNSLIGRPSTSWFKITGLFVLQKWQNLIKNKC
jgi:hypothetical protein